MKTKDIRELAVEDIQRKVEESRMELLKARFQAAVGQLGNRWRKRDLRRDVARMLTILKEKEMKEKKS
jgi:large subunit ribosomal protein L29